jgi:hypothetical protein
MISGDVTGIIGHGLNRLSTFQVTPYMKAPRRLLGKWPFSSLFGPAARRLSYDDER